MTEELRRLFGDPDVLLMMALLHGGPMTKMELWDAIGVRKKTNAARLLRLAEAGMVWLEKVIDGRRTRTVVHLTERGERCAELCAGLIGEEER